MKLFLLLTLTILSLALYGAQADKVSREFKAEQDAAQQEFNDKKAELEKELEPYKNIQENYDGFVQMRAEQNRLQRQEPDQNAILAEIQKKFKVTIERQDGSKTEEFIVDDHFKDENGNEKTAKEAFKDTKDKVFNAIDIKVDGLDNLANSEFIKHMPKDQQDAIHAGIANRKAKLKQFKDKWRWSPGLLTSNSSAAFKLTDFLRDFEDPTGPMSTMRGADFLFNYADTYAQTALTTGKDKVEALKKDIEDQFGNEAEKAALLANRADNFTNAINSSLLRGTHNKLEAKFILQDLDSWATKMGITAEKVLLKELLLNDKAFNKQMANTPLGVYVNGQIAKAAAMAKDDVCNQITQCTETNEKVFGEMFKFLDSSKRESESDVNIDPALVETRVQKD